MLIFADGWRLWVFLVFICDTWFLQNPGSLNFASEARVERSIKN